MCENIRNCCRICLEVDSDHVPILQDPTVHLHLKSCLAMTVSANDDLPKTICVTCVYQLSEFYNFQLNARCSQDWLESSIQENSKKSTEKTPIVQPLPDSEYNSDSLLEFLNNTANIEEYLNNLGKDDIPSIVNMFDRNNENSIEVVCKVTNHNKLVKQPSPNKKDSVTEKPSKINMEIDVLDSDLDIVKEILMKETEPKKCNQIKLETNLQACFACKAKFDSVQKLSQHLSICDSASRTCLQCNLLFDSKQKMQQHSISHKTSTLTCNCGKQFPSTEKLAQHHKICHIDYIATMGCIYRCKQCNETFKERFQLYRHAKDHVSKAEERICDICGHIFNGNEDLSKHRKELHDTPGDLMYRCKICNITSSDRKEMYLHVLKHTAKHKSDRHLCETCGLSFATRPTLVRHSLQHENDGHLCNNGNRTFGDVKTKHDHVFFHIEVAICDKCGQSVNHRTVVGAEQASSVFCGVNSYKLDAHSCV